MVTHLLPAAGATVLRLVVTPPSSARQGSQVKASCLTATPEPGHGRTVNVHALVATSVSAEVARLQSEPGQPPLLAVATGWARNPAGTGITGSRAIVRTPRSIRSWNTVARRSRRRPALRQVWTRRAGTVGPDDRHEHQVPRPGPRRGPDQALRLDLVALYARRAVHDDLGALDRGFDTLARGQVTGHELDPLPALAAAPAEHPDVAPGIPQSRDDMPSQAASAAGDQEVWDSRSPAARLMPRCFPAAGTVRRPSR